MAYGGKLVAHGLRVIASTALNETKSNLDVIKTVLVLRILIRMKLGKHTIVPNEST